MLTTILIAAGIYLVATWITGYMFFKPQPGCGLDALAGLAVAVSPVIVPYMLGALVVHAIKRFFKNEDNNESK